MILAKIVGTVVSTKKNDSIDGASYRLVESCTQDGSTLGSYFVALDLLGAGPGELVLVAQGSSARQTGISKDKPIDAVIAGIVDIVEEKNKVVYQK